MCSPEARFSVVCLLSYSVLYFFRIWRQAYTIHDNVSDASKTKQISMPWSASYTIYRVYLVVKSFSTGPTANPRRGSHVM